MLSSVVESAPPETMPTLVASFVDIDVRETSAALALMGALLDDELAGVCRDAAASRRQPLPAEVADFTDQRGVGAYRLHGGRASLEHVLVGVATGGGARLTWVVMVDHAHGGAISDAFYAHSHVEQVREDFIHLALDTDRMTCTELSLADARAIIERGIAAWTPELPFPPRESWPLARPMLRASMLALPPGGTATGPAALAGPESAPGAAFGLPSGVIDLDEFAGDALDPLLEAALDAADVALSPGMSAEDREVLLQVLEAYGQMELDPRVCSTEIIDDVLYGPIVVMLSEGLALRVIDILALVAQYACSEQPRLNPPLATLLAHLEGERAEYAAFVTSPEARAGRVALLRAVDEALGFSGWSVDREDLAHLVGGEDVLDSLDDLPLPAEDVDLSTLPESVRDLVIRLDDRITKGLGHELGIEPLTAVRRLLVTIARTAPDVLARGKEENTAAALVWLVGKTNDVFYPRSELRIGDAVTAVGAKGSPGSRAYTLINASGLRRDGWHADILFGEPALLTSATRREIIELAAAADDEL